MKKRRLSLKVLLNNTYFFIWQFFTLVRLIKLYNSFFEKSKFCIINEARRISYKFYGRYIENNYFCTIFLEFVPKLYKSIIINMYFNKLKNKCLKLDTNSLFKKIKYLESEYQYSVNSLQELNEAELYILTISFYNLYLNNTYKYKSYW